MRMMRFNGKTWASLRTIPQADADFAASVFPGMGQPGPVTRPMVVAEAVWRAANDPSCPFRVLAGADAVQWAEHR